MTNAKLLEIKEISDVEITNLESCIVYHFAVEDAVNKIRAGGLRPFEEINPDYNIDPYRKEVDEFLDRYAPDGFSRTKCIYAWVNIEDSGPKRQQGTIPLAVRVNPKKVLVLDQECFDALVERFAAQEYVRLEEAERMAKRYWDSALTLEDYLKLAPEERKARFAVPEVLIPKPAPSEFIEFPDIRKAG
jgi:hypothetical protein